MENKLIYEDTVFISNQTDKNDVFKEIGKKLFEKDLVTEEYLDNLIERELKYPTALPLYPIDERLPNIAVPHTESKYVKATRIIPVKLLNPVVFYNMINPDEIVNVSFLFMILNADESQQSGILADIMTFIRNQPVEDLIEFLNQNDSNKIYEYLEEKFK